MMKRAVRPVDLPKLRRNMKNRSRIADTMCCGYPGAFAYLKFVLVWLVCIALDVLIGFRFELLYPVWLSIRNCYDSFRLQGLISSFHYSAFSVIFVCATVASDLIFFVILPVQVLLFLASSYIWIQFAWQTGERGFGSLQLFLWVLLISFEYSWRYRGDSPLYFFLESSTGSVFNFLTGGLLSSLVGLRESPSSETACESGLASLPACQYSSKETATTAPTLLGGFGAAITTAFAHSSSFGSVLCRPFAAHCIGYPMVTLGFGIKTYMSLWRVRRRQREVSKENEFYGKLLVEALPSVYEGSKMYSRSNGVMSHEQESVAEYETELPLSNLAICAPNGATSVRKTSRNSGSWKSQNGWKANGYSSTKKAQLDPGVISPRRDQLSEDDSASFCSVGELNSQIDDRLSLSSNEVDSDDEMVEQDDTSQADDSFSRLAPNRTNANKRLKGNVSRSKGGRMRGRNSQNQPELYLPCAASGVSVSANSVNNVLQPSSTQHDKQLFTSATNTSTSLSSVGNGVCATSSAVSLPNNNLYAAELETLRGELRLARSQENEMRCHLQQATNAEKQAKSELLQIKTKYEQTDSKLTNCIKAREQDRASMQLMEKRLIEAQTKTKDLEKELTTERRSKEHSTRANAHTIKTVECGETCKTKRAELERELRAVRRDLKIKEDLNYSYEEKFKQIQEQRENNDFQELQGTVGALSDKCQLLEQSLSAENRLKQDLFRVLTETRTQTESLQQQLRLKDIELAEMRTRLNTDLNDRSKHIVVSNTHPPVTLLRAPPGLPPPAPPMTNGCLPNTLARKMSSSISNEHSMEILTAVLSNAANNAYRSYAFSGHSGSNEQALFDGISNGDVQGTKISPAASISPPPMPHNAGPADGAAESGHFSAGKFVTHGTNSTSVRST